MTEENHLPTAPVSSQKERLGLLFVDVFLLLIVSWLALGQWWPSGGDKGFWFYSALLGLVLRNLPSRTVSLVMSRPLRRVTSRRVGAVLLAVVVLSSCVTLSASEATSAGASSGGAGFEIPWFSIDGGAAESQGGGFSLRGTIAQPDSAITAGGTFVLTGGFLAVQRTQGPCNSAGLIFCDGFESADTQAWSFVTGLP
jgi:hypothetical protein